MLFAKRTAAAVAALLAGGIIAGCGSSREPSIPISARLVGATGSSPGQIILSQLGKDHIGLQTARAQAVPVPPPVVTTTVVAGVKHTTSTPAPRPSASVIVPYSALVYDPTGKTYVFMQRSPLTFVEVPATVDKIAGDAAYLASGPKAGAAIVTVGAEELYGVQTGVLAQT
jgi:hypothetical protein